MDPNLSALLGALFLVAGTVAVLLMLRIYGRPIATAGRLRLVRIHRVAGWIFTITYVVLMVAMVKKVLLYGPLNPLQAVHMAVGVAIFPILLSKILIVRRYRKLSSLLPGLGLGVFTLAVVTVGMGVTPLLAARYQAPDTDDLDAGPELVAAGATLVDQRCQKCHDLDRVYDQKGKKSAELWESTLDRMIALEPPLADVRRPVLAYLHAELAAPDSPEGAMLTGAALVEARCAKCHALDRVFQPTKTREDWRTTVRRYAELLPDHIRPEEVEPIAAFLYEKRGREPDPADAMRQIFENHCGTCHNLSRATERAQERTISTKRWGRVVRKMKRLAGERGLQVWTDEDSARISEYLASLAPKEEEAD